MQSSKQINHNIIIAGEGGQGVQKLAEILARAAFDLGFKTSYIPNFTVEQRGGISMAFVKIGNSPIVYPKFSKADTAVILSARSLVRALRFMTRETLTIYNSSLASSSDFKKITKSKLRAIPATIIAEQINPRSFNMIFLGKILKELALIDVQTAKKEISKIFSAKYLNNPVLEEQNNAALDAGYQYE